MIPTLYNGQIPSQDTMSFEQRTSFHSGYKTCLLPIGFELWRFASQKDDNRFGAFWMDAQTMQDIMQTLHSVGNYTEQYKKENIRNSLAVLEKWSNLSWRVKVRLQKEVIGYVGETGSQHQVNEFSNDLPFGGGEKIQKVIETRIGRQVQYVIPRFRGLSDYNDWASIQHFVHV
jgi:hypothetical protein